MSARPVYGSPGVTGDRMARAIMAARRLSEPAAAAIIRPAGVSSIDELATAPPARTYYACRLLAEHGQGALW